MDRTRVTLLERAALGNQDAWIELDQLYRPFILGWFRSQGVGEDAADLTQEIMTALIHELPKFEHNRRTGAFRAWLRSTCLHQLLNHRRARLRRNLAVGGTEFLEQIHELPCPDDLCESDWDREHDRAVLRHLFAKLAGDFDSKTIEAFRQTTILDRPVADVATDLGLSSGAIYVARSRVMRRLREEAAGLIAEEMRTGI